MSVQGACAMRPGATIRAGKSSGSTAASRRDLTPRRSALFAPLARAERATRYAECYVRRNETCAFSSALLPETLGKGNRPGCHYLLTGSMYALHLQGWLDAYRSDQLLIVQQNDLERTPKLLLANASSDLTDANAIRALLADIEDVRRAKVERGLKNLDIGSVSVKLNGLSAMEVNRIRGIATHALDSMRALDRQRRAPGADDDDDEAPTPARSGGAAASGGAPSRLQAALRERDQRR